MNSEKALKLHAFRKTKNFSLLLLAEADAFQGRTNRSSGARRSFTESRIQYFWSKLIYSNQLTQSPDITMAANLPDWRTPGRDLASFHTNCNSRRHPPPGGDDPTAAITASVSDRSGDVIATDTKFGIGCHVVSRNSTRHLFSEPLASVQVYDNESRGLSYGHTCVGVICRTNPHRLQTDTVRRCP
jgi:hypothetical protein